MSEQEALDILKDFDCFGGLFTEPVGHDVTPAEREALEYLWAEWDYGYVPRKYREQQENKQ